MILINETTPEEIKFLEAPTERDQEIETKLLHAKRAAKAHIINRQNLQKIIKPGIALNDICEFVEKTTATLLKGELNNGVGFPTGVSINECAAHFSTNPNDPPIYLKETDVLKVDFGTHSNGIIMDSAFTVCFDPSKLELLKAAQAATMKGISLLKVDARLSDIGEAVDEVMRSFEIEIDGRKVGIKPVENLNGHSIEPFKIHGGVSIPCYKNGDMTKIEENKFYALETFATTGKGFVRDADSTDCSHYMAENLSMKPRIKNPKTIKVYETIKKEIKTLPFSPRNIDRYLNFESKPFIKMLDNLNFLDPYPPLNDTKGSFVAQFEHTCFVGKDGTQILTLGDDY